MRPPDTGDRLADPGAQLERTSLAWSRTAFSMAACGALLVRHGLVENVVTLIGFGCLTLVLSATMWVLAAQRYTRRRTSRPQHLLVGHRYTVHSVTGLTVVVCAVAAVAAVLSSVG